jgi:hypothetical protein
MVLSQEGKDLQKMLRRSHALFGPRRLSARNNQSCNRSRCTNRQHASETSAWNIDRKGFPLLNLLLSGFDWTVFQSDEWNLLGFPATSRI